MATTNGWGLIGTGRIAEDRILPGINAYEGNKLIGVVSRDPARANDFARRFNAKHAYTNYDDLLKNPEVTVVAIHTPNALHAEQAIAAARLTPELVSHPRTGMMCASGGSMWMAYQNLHTIVKHRIR